MSNNVEPSAANFMVTQSSLEINDAKGWQKREQRLFDHVNAHMKWMIDAAAINQKKHMRLSYASMWLAIIAPLFAVTSTQRTLSLGMPDGWLPIFSAIITVLLSLTEGVRRIGRYDDIWRTMDLAMMELRSVREVFRDAKVEHQIGSPERIAALKLFRKEADRVIAMAILAAHKSSKGAVQG
ncbi:hypothetical protein [Methylobacterium tarhaniae]|uniref:hypothetical protein n=1 Tax=Methylobacterium tarhaniae TaxID=1187852 RepID=UPI003D00AEC8